LELFQFILYGLFILIPNVLIRMNRKDLMREIKPLRPHPPPPITSFIAKNNVVPSEYERQALMMK
jgi:hypothetical protein